MHAASEIYVFLRLKMILFKGIRNSTSRRHSLSVWVMIVALSAAFVSTETTFLQAAERPPTKVIVEKVRLTEVMQTFPAIGRFVARQLGVVAALTSGPLEKSLVDVGERIKRGQVVARIVVDRLRAKHDFLAAELREKKAGLKTAEAQLKLTMGEMVRLDRLRGSAAFSPARYSDKSNEVSQFESKVTEAQSAVAKAQANLQLARIDLRNAEVRAPFDAVVVKRHAVAGAYLAVGDPVMTLVNDREMEIEADIPADRLEGIVPGRTITVRLEDGSELEAQVRAVVPSENTKTRTRPVRFRFMQADGPVVAANQSVTVMLPVARAKRVLTVHKDAVTSRGKSKVVMLVIKNAAKSRNVQLGAAVGDRFAVLSGLKEGDIVVVRGNEGLRRGQNVEFEAPGD